MSEELVTCEIREGIAEVFLVNPPMNALTLETRLALDRVFRGLEERLAEIRVVILAGSGEKAFAAGADIRAFLDLTEETARERLALTHGIFRRIEDFPAPVIAAIHGYCLGGGLELALCCDIRYASEEAQFGFPETKLAVFPGNGGTARALHVLGLGRFKELVYSGDTVSAQEARDDGLIERVVPTGTHLEAARGLAQKILKRGPLAVRAAKEVINRARDLTVEEALALETQRWAALAETEDMKEGARAFLERRRPLFKGR